MQQGFHRFKDLTSGLEMNVMGFSCAGYVPRAVLNHLEHVLNSLHKASNVEGPFSWAGYGPKRFVGRDIARR